VVYQGWSRPGHFHIKQPVIFATRFEFLIHNFYLPTHIKMHKDGNNTLLIQNHTRALKVITFIYQSNVTVTWLMLHTVHVLGCVMK